jgi:hypothetical protein
MREIQPRQLMLIPQEELGLRIPRTPSQQSSHRDILESTQSYPNGNAELQNSLGFLITQENFAIHTPSHFLKSAHLVDVNEPDGVNPDIKYAEACANQLRYYLETNEEKPSSRDFFLGTEMPELAHHGNHHARHFELGLKKVIRSYEEQNKEIFQGAFGQNILNAMLLTPYFHDWDQLNTELRMIQDPELVLSAKMGHAVAGAVQVLCLAEKYAELNGISLEQAQQITSMAAVMILRHDEPGNIVQAFNTSNRSAVGINDPKDLLVAFNADQLDFTTLSPAQIITILKAKKGSTFINGNASQFGLSPNFERDYADKLVQLEKDTDPLLTLDAEEKRKLTSGTEMVVWADLVDMVSPYWDAILRTFQSAPSKKRPFSWKAVKDNTESRINEIWKSIEDPKNGNGTLTDIERLFWELWHLDEFAKQTCLADVPFVKKFNREHAIMGAVALGMVAETILGDQDIENTIQTVYGTRMNCLNQKAHNQNKNELLNSADYWNKLLALYAEAGQMTKLLENKKNGHDQKDLLLFPENACWFHDKTHGKIRSY